MPDRASRAAAFPGCAEPDPQLRVLRPSRGAARPAPFPIEAEVGLSYIHDLGEALAAIRAVGEQIAGLARMRGAGWRVELVKSRLQMAQALDLFSTLLARSEAAAALPARDLTELREAASRFRTALAIHQAKFAAASIEASEAYDKSAGEVWNAGENFRETAERILSRA